jgi:ribosomal-protein-alanine N-acetyltransferase
MKFFGTNPIRELAEAEVVVQKFIALRSAPNPGVRWALEEKASGQLVGTCGLFAWNKEWRKCGTGYELARSAQGQGFMREALSAAFNWGSADMHLNRIEAQIHPHNEPSLRLAQALSFQKEGLLREVARWGGGFHDLLQLGLLRNDWAPQRGDA